MSPLNLLTHAEAIERLNGCSCLIEDLLHSLLRIFSKRLLNQRNFLDEACYATFNDLDEGSFWLSFFACSLFCDTTFVFD